MNEKTKQTKEDDLARIEQFSEPGNTAEDLENNERHNNNANAHAAYEQDYPRINTDHL